MKRRMKRKKNKISNNPITNKKIEVMTTPSPITIRKNQSE